MPSNFYKFEFRDVRAEEKTYHEAEYALDIFLIKPNGRIQTEMFETYILTMTEDSRNIIYTMASKDIQNSKLIQNQIDRYFEPMPFSRFVKKVNDLTYKLNTN